jgi:hypothetical protein
VLNVEYFRFRSAFHLRFIHNNPRPSLVCEVRINPVHHHCHFVAKTNQKHQVERQPRHPSRHSGQFQGTHLRHRLRSSDGGHGSLVPVFKRLAPNRHTIHLLIYDLRHVSRHLHGRRRNTRHRLAIGLQRKRQVTNGKNLRMPRQAQIPIHLHATRSVQFHAQLLGERRCGHARRPQNIPRAQDLTVGQFHLALTDVQHLHAQSFQQPRGTAREILWQVPQNPWPAFHQNDVRLGRVNVTEIMPQDVTRQFGKRSPPLRQLNPIGTSGRTAARAPT